MSFILDALKKSETERQRQTGPAFATIAGGGQRKNLPRWAIVLAALLLINLVVILAIALFPDNSPDMSSNRASTTQTAQSDRRRVTPPARQPAQAKTSSRPEVRSLAGEVEKSSDSTNASGSATAPRSIGTSTGVSASPGTSGTVVTAGSSSNSSTQQGGFVVYQSFNQGVASSDLPTLSDLRSQGLLSIPEMHMDIHVYGETESDRFIFINMRKYTKGETLKEGPVVEDIRPDGVVLNEHGLRFFLPRD